MNPDSDVVTELLKRDLTDCSVFDIANLTMKDTIAATIKDIPDKGRNYTYSYFTCKLLNNVSWEKAGWVSILYNSASAFKKMPDLVSELVALFFYNNVSRNYVLTYLFGNPSTMTNINY